MRSIPDVFPPAADIAETLGVYGAVIFRRAIPQSVLELLVLLCSAAFSILDLKVKEHEAGEARADDPLGSRVEAYKTLQFIADDVVRAVLSNAFLGQSGFEKVAGVLRDILSPALRHDVEFLPGKSTFRRQGTSAGAKRSAILPWHRDAHAVRTADIGDCLNCWIPLHSVGVSRPSLQVVIGSSPVMRNVPVDYSLVNTLTHEQVIRDFGSENICTALMEPGDFLLFDHHTLHRTQPMGDEYPMRVSGEVRFVGK